MKQPKQRRRLRQQSSQESDDEMMPAIPILSSSEDEFVNDRHNDAAYDRNRTTNWRLKRLRQDGYHQEPNENTTEVKTDSSHGDLNAEWECQTCTYLNDYSTNTHVCSMCLTPREPARIVTRKLSSWLNPATTQTKKSPILEPSVDLIDSASSDDDEQHIHSKSPTQTTHLWSDGFKPQKVEELCVHKKKIQEVKEWLQQSTKRLLFLCGPSGCGKSTTVRCLARELGYTVKEWSDSVYHGKFKNHRHMQDEHYQNPITPWDDFIEFIHQSLCYSALPVALPSKTKRSKSENERLKPQSQIILIETWPQNLPEASTSSENFYRAFHHVLMPNAGGSPVIFIVSDSCDAKKKMDIAQLNRIFSEKVISSPYTTVIHFNAVPPTILAKSLQGILVDRRHDNNVVSNIDLQRVVEQSDGDIRHAINMLQLKFQQQHRRKSKQKQQRQNSSIRVKLDTMRTQLKENDEDDDDDALARDPFISDFRIVGKILHSSKDDSKSLHTRVRALDRALDTTSMSIDRVLALIHSNAAPFYTEIEDLEGANALMSLSEMWLASSYQNGSSSQVFKQTQDLIRSLLIRSIALTNNHPAPSAFRPITGPRTYATNQRMIDQREELTQHLMRNLGTNASDNSRETGFSFMCRKDVVAFQIGPFLRMMQRSHDKSTNNDHGLAVDDEIEDSDGDW